MIVSEYVRWYENPQSGENDSVYRKLSIANSNRQLDFLRSAVECAISLNRPFLSQTLIKALQFHALACLHSHAGEYRPCEVVVSQLDGAPTYKPPAHYRIPDLMDDFVNQVNWTLYNSDTVTTAAFVLWRLNHIHPFINGNGRTARACCHYVICVKVGRWIAGDFFLPELLNRNKKDYYDAIKYADEQFASNQPMDQVLVGLTFLIRKLLGIPPPVPSTYGHVP